MRKSLSSLPVAALMLAMSAADGAAQTATATATYEVQAINEVSVSGNPGALIINTAAELAGVTDATTTWSVTTNQTGAKVTGAIDTNMPAGLTLKVDLTAPSVGTSAGAVTLSSVAADLVTGMTEVQGSTLGVTYTLSALPSAGVVASATKTVTYTITGGV